MTTKTTRYIVQIDRLGGQVGKQKWYWGDIDYRVSYATLNEAVDVKLEYEAMRAAAPNKFVRGVRVIKRVTVTTETVVVESAVA